MVNDLNMNHIKRGVYRIVKKIAPPTDSMSAAFAKLICDDIVVKGELEFRV